MTFIAKYILGTFTYGAIRNIYYLPKIQYRDYKYDVNGKKVYIYKKKLFGDYLTAGIFGIFASIYVPFVVIHDMNRIHAYFSNELRHMHEDYFKSQVFPYNILGYTCIDTNLFPIEVQPIDAMVDESKKTS